MRNFVLVFMVIMGISGFGFAQKVDSTVVKTHKKIIIKTMDDGKESVKVIEGEPLKFDSDEPIQVDVINDSVFVRIIKKGTETSDSFLIEEFETFDMSEVEGFEKDFGWEEKFPRHGNKMMILKDLKFGPFGKGGENKGKLGVFIEETSKGVKVTEVEDYSAAYSVGMFAGDVIKKVNGVKITNVEELQREINSRNAGDVVKIKVKRNGKCKVFEARLHGQGSDTEIMDFMPEHGGGFRGQGGPHGFMFMDNGCCSEMKSFGCGHENVFQNGCSHGVAKGCGKHEVEIKCCSSGHKSSGCGHGEGVKASCSHGEAKSGCKGDEEKKFCSSAQKSSGCSHGEGVKAKCSHGEATAGCKGDEEKKCCNSAQKSSGCSHDKVEKAKCSQEETKTCTKHVEEKKCEGKELKETAPKPKEKK